MLELHFLPLLSTEDRTLCVLDKSSIIQRSIYTLVVHYRFSCLHYYNPLNSLRKKRLFIFQQLPTPCGSSVPDSILFYSCWADLKSVGHVVTTATKSCGLLSSCIQKMFPSITMFICPLLQ